VVVGFEVAILDITSSEVEVSGFVEVSVGVGSVIGPEVVYVCSKVEVVEGSELVNCGYCYFRGCCTGIVTLS